MASKKVYAIKEGFDFENNKKVENIIVNTWNECLSYVKGAKGAKYKSFESLQEAKDFLDLTPSSVKKDEIKFDENILQAYVDGSFDIETKRYSYGLVLVKNNVIVHIDRGAAKDTKQAALRQIAGELQASMEAMNYASNNLEEKLLIFYDYAGIANHATGVWQRKEESSQRYYEFYQDIVKNKNIQITFVKVDSHTGDLYNEIADEQAKIALNMRLPKASDKLIRANKVNVQNNKVYELLNDIVSDEAMKNVIVRGSESTPKEVIKIAIEDNSIKDINVIDEIKKLLKINKEKAIKYIDTLSSEEKNNIIIKLIK